MNAAQAQEIQTLRLKLAEAEGCLEVVRSHLGDVERIKKELEEERSKTLSELGQVSTRALVAFMATYFESVG